VAGFIGSPTMNLIAGRAGNTSATAGFGIKNAVLPLQCPVATDALLGVRPEHIILTADARWRGEVSVVEPTGADTFVVVKTEAGDVTVRTSPQTQARPGDAVGLEIQAARVNWFDAGSGVRL
jgi:multiple sugar transport system ATP-binding protein